ncbi:MAG: iron-sulfur cluster assembly scaffold protein [Rhodobacteraceae bacterium]|nr:iron-sulfur cluster assembly scaffold protein [Paracoccaceae bacterium]MCY4251659.1 iron-sulfur cluster assembly scaffold protein [Paracoccaceae bacterium]
MTSVDEKVTKLYTQRILELASNIPLLNRLENYEGSSKVRSPLCGSTVTVDLVLKEGLISEFGQDVKACALGQATASIVGSRIIGRSFNEVSLARDQMEAMLKKKGDPPNPPFEELEILYPAQDYKNRHASIMLVFDATLNAMEQALDKDSRKSLN